MSKTICPGQDTRFWRPGDIFEVDCSTCGNPVEFFKDDSARRCAKCGQRILNPKLSLGCAQWCEHAKECLGFDPTRTPTEESDEISLVDRIIEAVKREFGDDQKRITHALLVLENAQEILAKEGGNPRVALAAALLHDIGIREAERKHGSASGSYQETEGPPIARKIMEELHLNEETIEEVCTIVGCHHRGMDTESPEFRIVWDADWLVNLPEEYPNAGPEDLKRKIGKIFKTKTGREKAYALLEKNSASPRNPDGR